jgi:hypothetical protein
MRETKTEEERAQGKLTATVLEKIFEARREASAEPNLPELAHKLNVDPLALDAILRYHDNLPDYKVRPFFSLSLSHTHMHMHDPPPRPIMHDRHHGVVVEVVDLYWLG